MEKGDIDFLFDAVAVGRDKNLHRFSTMDKNLHCLSRTIIDWLGGFNLKMFGRRSRWLRQKQFAILEWSDVEWGRPWRLARGVDTFIDIP